MTKQCTHCGKTRDDFDLASDGSPCLDATVFSPAVGDWQCNHRLNEAWDSRELGQDERHVRVSRQSTNETINTALGDMMITNPRNTAFTQEQIAALEHVMATARRKKFYAQLIANAYNNCFPCDLWTCARYTNGEQDKRLITGLWLIVQLSARGVESHEYYGEPAVEQLIKDWGLRDKPIT